LSTTHIFQSLSLKLVSERVDPALVSVSSGRRLIAVSHRRCPRLSKLFNLVSELPNTVKQHFNTVCHCLQSSTADRRRPPSTDTVPSENHRLWTASPRDSQPRRCRRQCRRHAPPRASSLFAPVRRVTLTRHLPVAGSSPSSELPLPVLTLKPLFR